MAQSSKVQYRPIEAGIRWSGLILHERRILEVLRGNRLPTVDDFPEWPALRLNTERIYDGILYKELRYSINGKAGQGEPEIDNPNLTIRHIDLKAWMAKYYPNERPRFLFSRTERRVHPEITIDAVHALLVQRDAMQSLLTHREQVIQSLRTQRHSDSKDPRADNDPPLSPRSEMAYLHIVGSMLDLLVGHSPSGQPYSSFRTQESVISALIAHHGKRLGIAPRTLEAKFAAARRALSRE